MDSRKCQIAEVTQSSAEGPVVVELEDEQMEPTLDQLIDPAYALMTQPACTPASGYPAPNGMLQNQFRHPAPVPMGQAFSEQPTRQAYAGNLSTGVEAINHSANEMGDCETVPGQRSNEEGLAVSQPAVISTESNADGWVPVAAVAVTRPFDPDTPAQQNWNACFGQKLSELNTSAETGSSIESGQNNESELDEGAVSDTDSIDSCDSDYLFPGRAKLPKKRGRGRPAENQAKRGRRVEKGFKQLESFKKNSIKLTYKSIEKCVRMLLPGSPTKPRKAPTSGQKRTKEIPIKFQPEQLKFEDVIQYQYLLTDYWNDRYTVFEHFDEKVKDAKRDAARVKKKKEELDRVKQLDKTNLEEFERKQKKLENILLRLWPVMDPQDLWIQRAVRSFWVLEEEVGRFKKTKFDRKVDPLKQSDGNPPQGNANVKRCRKREETEKDFYDKRALVLQDYGRELQRIWNIHLCYRAQKQAASQNALVPSTSAAPSMQDYNFWT